MHNIIRAAIRNPALKAITFPKQSAFARREFTRTIWHMSKNPEIIPSISTKLCVKPSMGCSCGCGKQIHTKGIFLFLFFILYSI